MSLVAMIVSLLCMQAEHTGQQALMRLQLKELSSTVGNDVLQQLAVS